MDPGETAPEGAPPTRRFERGRARRQRCFRTRCGAHAMALVGWATISGLCGVCGSSDLVPVEAEETLARAGVMERAAGGL